MTAIKFRPEFFELIKNGSKTQTLRRPSGRIDVVPGDFAACVFDGLDDVIYVTITDVGYKMWKTLTDDDAQREGFEDVDELKRCLLKIYPDVNFWDRFYYYRFEVEGCTEKIKED